MLKQYDKCCSIGTVLLETINGIVDKAVSGHYYRDIGGVLMPTVNSMIYQSEICNKLLEVTKHPVACCWYQTEGKKAFSLRSVKDYDCSAIAVKMGGGGHKNASGFIIST